MNIYYYIQARQTGKTEKLLKLLSENENSILIVHNLQIKNLLRNRLLHSDICKRIYAVHELLNMNDYRGKKSKEFIYIDDYDLFSCEQKKNIIEYFRYNYYNIKLVKIVTTLKEKINLEYLKICKLINKSNFESLNRVFFDNLNTVDKLLFDGYISGYNYDLLYDCKTNIEILNFKSFTKLTKNDLPDWKYRIEILNEVF